QVPVMRVVDVAGEVEVAGPEPPVAALGALGRLGVAEPEARLAPARALAVCGDEVFVEPHRAPARGVEADPERDRLDRGRYSGDRRPPLGAEAADSAAEGAQG